ncbi:MAG: hypothetical protein J7501_06720, partial [Bdellovibrio sp.]|nr:hypothetical protein [Bdellovibrio sp.]
MLKLKIAILTTLLMSPLFAFALSDGYSVNLVEKSIAAIESTSNRTAKINLARELKSLVIQRAEQIGDASLKNPSYDAESTELTDLIVALDRATLKTGTQKECEKSFHGLLTDAQIEDYEKIEAMGWT